MEDVHARLPTETEIKKKVNLFEKVLDLMAGLISFINTVGLNKNISCSHRKVAGSDRLKFLIIFLSPSSYAVGFSIDCLHPHTFLIFSL
jgi:hypothetical protein